MTEYAIVEGTLEHAEELAANMRQADLDEIWALGHSLPMDSLKAALAGAGPVFTGLADGRVMCMFGVGHASLVSRVGIPWMLTSYEIEKHGKQFLVFSRRYIERCVKPDFDYLYNLVDERNTVAVEWLRWLGFKIHDPQPAGPDQQPFHLFTLDQRECANQ